MREIIIKALYLLIKSSDPEHFKILLETHLSPEDYEKFCNLTIPELINTITISDLLKAIK